MTTPTTHEGGGHAVDINANFDAPPATSPDAPDNNDNNDNNAAKDISGAFVNDAKDAPDVQDIKPAAPKKDPGVPRDPADNRPETKREIRANPLKDWSRTGAIYVDLPSRGRWGNPETASGLSSQIEVLPMTTRDEVTARNPNALVNGEAVRSLLKSCTSIANPEDLVKNDVDFLLAAIAYATHGDDYSFQVQCGSEACADAAKEAGETLKAHTLTVNLSGVIDSRNEDFFTEDGTPKVFDVELPNGITARIGPRTFKMDELLAVRMFEDASKFNAVMSKNSKLPETEKMKIVSDSVMSQVQLAVDALADSIDFVEIPAAKGGEPVVVTDKTHIREWLQELRKDHLDMITAKAAAIHEIGFRHKTRFKCPECGAESDVDIPFDMTSFFGQDS